jgi:hypothetical protein
MPHAKIRDAGMCVALFAVSSAFIKFILSVSQAGHWEKSLKIYGETFSLCAAVLAIFFFLVRDHVQSAEHADMSRISAIESWVATQNARELTNRVCFLERQLGVDRNAQSNTFLKCPTP